MKSSTSFCVLLLILLASCHSNAPAAEGEGAPAAGTPVGIAHPETGAMSDSVELKRYGYLPAENVCESSGQWLSPGIGDKTGATCEPGPGTLYAENKEAENLGNTINKLDSSFRFTGLIPIKAPGSGYITQLAIQAGSYVQDGEQLATISDDNSFAFVLSIPYEYTSLIAANRKVTVWLPDGQQLTGQMEAPLPTVDSVSQTQNYVIRVAASRLIPENLIAKVRLMKRLETNTVFVPKAAVLSDEAQSEYWIMKMTDSTTAVKQVIRKGMESGNKIEVLSPVLTPQDRVLVSGNYGLPDTATVTIVNKEPI